MTRVLKFAFMWWSKYACMRNKVKVYDPLQHNTQDANNLVSVKL